MKEVPRHLRGALRGVPNQMTGVLAQLMGVPRHAVTGPVALVLLGQQAMGVAGGDEDAKGEAGHQRRT